MEAELGICLIAKDEKESYLREWIDYHFLVGADYICIYDNGSRIPIKSIINETNVEIVDWPGAYAQINAYNNFTERYRGTDWGKIKWGAFIDADEFIVSKCGDIKKNLAGHGGFGGLALSWLMFGSNGLIDNETSQINAFTKRANDDFPPNNHIKTIAQLSLTTGCHTPHHFTYVPPYFCANEYGQPVHGPYSNISIDFIYINHYYTRSYNEYLFKLAKGRADAPLGRADFEVYNKNDVEDFTLVNLYKELKSRVVQ